MAITPTGAIYKTLTFDGESSADYGVYITGQAVFNAPEREVEMITIPGRNGTFALDKGRFENVTVTYPAGIFADTDEDFSEAISDFRNWLCSRQGYVRLEDDYNPNEYRLAVYKSGLEVELAQLKAGEFNIVFECKPQRFLKSGETEITVESGDDITNPTLFASSPLIEAWGYGSIAFNGSTINIEDVQLGKVILANPTGETTTTIINFSTASLNTGDTITLEQSKSTCYIDLEKNVDDAVLTTTAGTLSATFSAYVDRGNLIIYATIPETSFAQGTSSTKNSSVSCAITYTDDTTTTVTYQITMRYAATTDQILMFDSITGNDWVEVQRTYNFGTLYGISTLHTAGNPIYIDCDLAECYKYVGGEIASLNRYIDLGSNLPTLAVGANTFTFDNTITALKVVPRWWKI